MREQHHVCCWALCRCPGLRCPALLLEPDCVRAQILSKTMDSTTLTPDKVELSTLAHNPATGLVRALSLHLEALDAGIAR